MHRLWDIGAAGLSDSKIGWPGVKNPGTHYTLSKFMRERRPQGGGWQQMSLWLMQGTKKEYPSRNFAQLIRYVTVSIFICCGHAE
jgi:hypothetical protein